MFRLNFLPIVLCFSMNRMYQFYEFVSMITFWYVCSYVLMVVYPRVSAKSAKDHPQHFFYMIVKLALFVGLITTLHMSEVNKIWKVQIIRYSLFYNHSFFLFALQGSFREDIYSETMEISICKLWWFNKWLAITMVSGLLFIFVWYGFCAHFVHFEKV